jgi:hypothetical protein
LVALIEAPTRRARVTKWGLGGPAAGALVLAQGVLLVLVVGAPPSAHALRTCIYGSAVQLAALALIALARKLATSSWTPPRA